MEAEEVELLGIIHSVDLNLDSHRDLVEDNRELKRLTSFLSKKISEKKEAKQPYSIAIEFAPENLKAWRELIPLLKAQPNPEKLVLPSNQKALKKTPFWKVINSIREEISGDLFEAMERFRNAVYGARLIDFLEKEGVEIIPIGSEELAIKHRKALLWASEKKSFEVMLEREGYFEERIVELKESGKLPETIIVGALHVIDLGERLDHHGIKYRTNVIGPLSLRAPIIRDWKKYLEVRDRFLRKERQQKPSSHQRPRTQRKRSWWRNRFWRK